MNKILVLFFLLCLIYGCKYDKGQKNKIRGSEVKVYVDEKTSWLIDKTVISMDSILPFKKNDDYVAFLFSYHDCETCVDAGFYISKKLDALSNRQYVFSVASMLNPATYQERNKYYNYIYYDNKDLIRKELKYLPTPVMLLLDKNNTIKAAYFPKDTLKNSVDHILNSWGNVEE